MAELVGPMMGFSIKAASDFTIKPLFWKKEIRLKKNTTQLALSMWRWIIIAWMIHIFQDCNLCYLKVICICQPHSQLAWFIIKALTFKHFPHPSFKRDKHVSGSQVENEPSGKKEGEKRIHIKKNKATRLHFESHMADFIVHTPRKSLTLLMFVFRMGPRAKIPSGRDLNYYPEAFQDMNQKVYSMPIQLILLLLIPARLKLLSLHSRPSDTAYHSSTNSQWILNSMTRVRLNPSR